MTQDTTGITLTKGYQETTPTTQLINGVLYTTKLRESKKNLAAFFCITSIFLCIFPIPCAFISLLSGELVYLGIAIFAAAFILFFFGTILNALIGPIKSLILNVVIIIH